MKTEDWEVTWTDRNYKSGRKVVKYNPQGPAGGTEDRARALYAKMNRGHANSKYGLYRTLNVHRVEKA